MCFEKNWFLFYFDVVLISLYGLTGSLVTRPELNPAEAERNVAFLDAPALMTVPSGRSEVTPSGRSTLRIRRSPLPVLRMTTEPE